VIKPFTAELILGRVWAYLGPDDII